MSLVHERPLGFVRFALAAAACCAVGCGSPGGAPANATPNDPNDPEPALTGEQLAALAELSPRELPAPPEDVSNRWADDAKAASFGQRLFFETRLSGALLDGDNDGSQHALGSKGETGKVACAGCHLPESGFSDTRTVRQQISLAAGWGRRRAPSLLDVAHSRLLMWDGRHDALYNQIFGALESPVEMNSSRLYAATQIYALHREEYESVFGPMPALDDTAQFPALKPTEIGCDKLDKYNGCPVPMRGVPGDAATYDALTPEAQEAVTRVMVNAGKALGAYERLLSCGQSRFDRWVQGDASALSRSEQRGAGLFVGKGKCSGCHSGPFLSDEKFHNVGMRAVLVATVFLNANDPGAAEGVAASNADPLNVKGAFSDGDDGRSPEDIDDSLQGAFKTPRLRCLTSRPSFMHTGQIRKLSDVVAFFDHGGDVGGFVGTNELSPLGLTELERADLTAFLSTLDGPGPAAELLKAP